MFPKYDPAKLEPACRQRWQELSLHRTPQHTHGPKAYILDFFPYPSGEGLHVGHCRNYVPTDVISRYSRMTGARVLHPMGWDAFGEPAEQHAIARGVHPRQTTDRNTANFRRQMELVGTSYDWEREIDSSQPEYYRWTQWFFLLMFRRGLAYRDTSWQWWCPTCQTTLSSHEVQGGVCWRGHSGVTRREIPAWYFRITAYADELVAGLDEIDWPEPVKAMQRSWIGRSLGCEITFQAESGEPIPVFTTRADTAWGATYLALAPEHPLVASLSHPEQRSAVEAYVAQSLRLSEIERQRSGGEKTGVFTGSCALNPLSGERLPVWIADYVLPGYGSGAVMGVPAHDERDFEFARTFRLPVRRVVVPPDGSDNPPTVYTGEGFLVDSGAYTGLDSQAAREQIAADLARAGQGGPKLQYRMRDWLISRQRYWGTPIPILYCEQCGTLPVPESDLPVLLPEMRDFSPDGSGRSPLARLPEFINTTCPDCGGPARRETDTMGGFACSSWYFLRFASPHLEQAPFDPQAVRDWLPVDLYVGGAEHAVLHLLYARFWTKVLADAGLLPFREPFARLLNQGQMMGADGQRMSKSRGNVITPDEMAASYGADALRLYVMFMAPFDQDVAWNTAGISGTRRFLNRVWDLYARAYAASAGAKTRDAELDQAAARTVQQVTERLQGFRFNTMISTLMEFSNLLVNRLRRSRWQSASFHQALDALLVLLAPSAPHFAEGLWQATGHSGSVHQQPWPAWETSLEQAANVQLPVQVDGRLRAVIETPVGAGQEEVQAQALAQPRVALALQNRRVSQVIYVPGRAFNIVTEASGG